MGICPSKRQEPDRALGLSSLRASISAARSSAESLILGGDVSEERSSAISREKVLAQALDLLPDEGVLGVYFSVGSLAPPSRHMETLETRYWTYKDKALPFDVLRVPLDVYKGSSEQYFKKMPWQKVSFSDRGARSRLAAMLQVSELPSLVLLGKTGKVISLDGFGILSSDEDGTSFPWTKASASYYQGGSGRSTSRAATLRIPGFDDQSLASEAGTLPINEAGYKEAAKLKSNYAMGQFSRKVLESRGREVADAAGFRAVLWEHSGITQGPKTFEKLCQDLSDVSVILDPETPRSSENTEGSLGSVKNARARRLEKMTKARKAMSAVRCAQTMVTESSGADHDPLSMSMPAFFNHDRVLPSFLQPAATTAGGSVIWNGRRSDPSLVPGEQSFRKSVTLPGRSSHANNSDSEPLIPRPNSGRVRFQSPAASDDEGEPSASSGDAVGSKTKEEVGGGNGGKGKAKASKGPGKPGGKPGASVEIEMGVVPAGKGPGKIGPGKPGKGPGPPDSAEDAAEVQAPAGKGKGPKGPKGPPPPGAEANVDAAAEGPAAKGAGKGPGKGPASPGDAKGSKGPAGKGPAGPGGDKGKGKGKKGKPVKHEPTREEKKDWIGKSKVKLRWKRLLAPELEDTLFADRSKKGSPRGMPEPKIDVARLKGRFIEAPKPQDLVDDPGGGGGEFTGVGKRKTAMEIKPVKESIWSDHPKAHLFAMALKATFSNFGDSFYARLERMELGDLASRMSETEAGNLENLVGVVKQFSEEQKKRLQEPLAESKYEWQPKVEGTCRRLVMIPLHVVRLELLHEHLELEDILSTLHVKVGQVSLGLHALLESEGLHEPGEIPREGALRETKALSLVCRKLLAAGNYLNAGDAKLGRADGFDVADVCLIGKGILRDEPKAPTDKMSLLEHIKEAEVLSGTPEGEAILEGLSELQPHLKGWHLPKVTLAKDEIPEGDLKSIQTEVADAGLKLGFLNKSLLPMLVKEDWAKQSSRQIDALHDMISVHEELLDKLQDTLDDLKGEDGVEGGILQILQRHFGAEVSKKKPDLDGGRLLGFAAQLTNRLLPPPEKASKKKTSHKAREELMVGKPQTTEERLITAGFLTRPSTVLEGRASQAS